MIVSSGCNFIHSKKFDDPAVDSELSRLEKLKNVANVVKWVGVGLLIAGVVGAALFFSAPVSVPLLACLAAMAIPSAGLMLAIGAISDGKNNACCGPNSEAGLGLVGGGVLLGGVGSIALGSYLWEPVKQFVYAPNVAIIAGAIGGGLALAGGALLGVGVAMENYYDRKIQELTHSLPDR